MARYFSSTLIQTSFKRLSSRAENGGKKALERTSALMYFLAFDAAMRKVGKYHLDLDPETANGKNDRTLVQSEFIKLVLLKPDEDSRTRQICELGKIQTGVQEPEKRISSNFFTVPLKKASELSKANSYPRRPGPVLKMGRLSANMKWGVKHHEQWEENFPKLLSEVKSNTPIFDLVVFILRNDNLPQHTDELREIIFKAASTRFSDTLVAFWLKQIDAEKVFIKHALEPFQAEYRDALSISSEGSTTEKFQNLRALNKDDLIKRISYLERVLDEKQVKYQKIFY
jgi:hypothetical protein